MFGKLLRSLRGASARAAHRQVRHLGDVLPGDLISFKPRRLLPPSLQGETVEATIERTYINGLDISESSIDTSLNVSALHEDPTIDP